MALITLRQLLDHAADHAYGLPAFNISSIEQGVAILEAAQAIDAPIILQACRRARKYAGDIMIANVVEALQKMHPSIPICLHQDHGTNIETCLSALQNGFTSVMIDGSLLEDGMTASSYEYNLAITQQVSDLAHMVGASVEGELGGPQRADTDRGTDSEPHGSEGKLDKSKPLTDPNEAMAFVAQTKVDALAVAIGTSHGAYRGSREPGEPLAVDLIEAIQRKLPNTHIVMHGSSVPEEWWEALDKNGAQIGGRCDMPLDEMVRGIRHGVRKVNIDTDLWLAMLDVHRPQIPNTSSYTLRNFLRPAMDAMTKVCRVRLEAFGAAGKAHNIPIVPLAEMAKRYKQGKLDPQTVFGARPRTRSTRV